MNILLTGGAGYIGSTTANLLLDQGHRVTVIDNLSTGNVKNIPKNQLDASSISSIVFAIRTKRCASSTCNASTSWPSTSVTPLPSESADS